MSTEYGAIEWYDEAISKIKASGLPAEDEEALIQGIEEIRHDEEHHAFHLEKLAELVKNKISVAQADKIHENKNLFKKDYGKKKVEESFKDLERDLGRDFRKIKLEDDGSETGGIAFAGETLGDFLENDLDDNYEFTLDELNKVLKDCGIKPLKKKVGESKKKIMKPKHITNESSFDDIRIYMNTWKNYNENGADLSAYGIESIADGWLTVDEAIDFAEEHAEDEPFINDTDGVPFEISEYDNAIETLQSLQELQESGVDEDVVAAIMEAEDYSVKEAIEVAESGDYYFYPDVNNDADLGYAVVEEFGSLGDVLGDRVVDYIDEDAMRDAYRDDVERMFREDAAWQIAQDEGIDEDEVTDEMIDEYVEGNLDDYLDTIIEDEIGLAEAGEIDLSDYFDYEAFGRDLRISDGYTYTDKGAIHINY